MIRDCLLYTSREARKRDTLIKFVSKEKLDSLSSHEKHQGVVAIAAAYEYATVEDCLLYTSGY